MSLSIRSPPVCAQAGLDLLIQVDAPLPPSGKYATISGGRTREIHFSEEEIDITHINSPGRWRELHPGGIRHLDISHLGVVFGDHVQRDVFSAFMNQALLPTKIIVPAIGLFKGLFKFLPHYWGHHDKEIIYEIKAKSSGPIELLPFL